LILSRGKSKRELLSKFKVVAKTKELKAFNQTMAEKSKELGNKFTNHSKILEKIQDDLMYIHQTIKMVEAQQKETIEVSPATPKDN
jgi:esterase/lipase